MLEVVEQPVEIREYRRPLYNCPRCGWSGYSSLPQGMSKKDSAMGGDFVALSAGNGYGGNLTWRKQEYVVEYVKGSSHFSR